MQEDITKVGITEILFREVDISTDRYNNHNKDLHSFSASELISNCMIVLRGIQQGVKYPDSMLNELITSCKGWSQTDIEFERL